MWATVGAAAVLVLPLCLLLALFWRRRRRLLLYAAVGCVAALIVAISISASDPELRAQAEAERQARLAEEAARERAAAEEERQAKEAAAALPTWDPDGPRSPAPECFKSYRTLQSCFHAAAARACKAAIEAELEAAELQIEWLAESAGMSTDPLDSFPYFMVLDLREKIVSVEGHDLLVKTADPRRPFGYSYVCIYKARQHWIVDVKLTNDGPV